MRGDQRLSMVAGGISGAAWVAAAICLLVAWPQGQWLWLVSIFNLIQVAMTLIKYIPQAWMNYQRKSTAGWSIGNILLDLSGGAGNFLQMGVQSIDQGSTQNFSGNVGKLLLSLTVIAFDLFFIVQHYVLYRNTSILGPEYYPLDLEEAEGRGEGYWDYVEGANEAPPIILDIRAFAEQVKSVKDWHQGSAKVMYWLSVSVSNSIVGHIQDATSPKDAWDNLIAFNATNTRARKIQLKNELNTRRFISE
ncbi:hypothetical protein L7F22_028298 [Adiantum nelumboides]|nr:hypothetical protein [Adiantum nelumboides]